MSDTLFQMFSWVVKFCLLVVAMIALYLTHLFFFNSQDRPWIGYAHDVEAGCPKFWGKQYETRRDCLEGMTYIVSMQIEPPSYSMPVGCGYVGGNSWLVKAVNMWSVGYNLHCIAHL